MRCDAKELCCALDVVLALANACASAALVAVNSVVVVAVDLVFPAASVRSCVRTFSGAAIVVDANVVVVVAR